MGRTFDDVAKQFVKENKDVTDVASLKSHQENANELIADHLNATTKGWTDAQKQNLYEAIAKNSSSSDYANFTMSKDHHLHVTTRGFDKPINFGMSTDSDLNDLTKKMAGLHHGGSQYEETAPIYR